MRRRDDQVAREEVFGGTMRRLFEFVARELLAGRPPAEALRSIPVPYFELFLLYQYRQGLSETEDPLAAVSAYLDWRKGLQLQFNPSKVDDIFCGNVDAPSMHKLMPECVIGHDKCKQPVLYLVMSQNKPLEVNNMAKIMKNVTTKNIFDYHLWQHEALVGLFYHRSRQENKIITSCTVVMDIDNLTTENASSEFFHITFRRADILREYFPYLINKIVVINANEEDLRLIHKIRELCKSMAPSPKSEIFVYSKEQSQFEMLSQHIDPSELPSEYGGSHRYDIATVPHPFYECVQLQEELYNVTDENNDDVVSPLHSLTLSLPATSSAIPFPQMLSSTIPGKGSALPPTTASFQDSSHTTLPSCTNSLQHHFDEEDSLYPPQSFTPSYLASVDSQSSRTYSSSSSKLPVFARSVSVTSASGGSVTGFTQMPRTDLLAPIPMTPNARAALTAFAELFASNDIPLTPAYSQHIEIANSNYEENAVMTTFIDPSVFSSIRDGAGYVSVGSDFLSGFDAFKRPTSTWYDTIAIRTSTGVAILQKSQSSQGHFPNSVESNSPVSDSQLESSCLPISCRKYQGTFAMADGRIFLLSRGVSLSGWLQKWPMKSQSIGGATHRYFVLDSASIRYWKTVPKICDRNHQSTSQNYVQNVNDQAASHIPSSFKQSVNLEPCKGQIKLTHETVIRRSKTLFGHNTIEIKSEDDCLTVCAYSSAEDTAWYNEIFNAVEKLKKDYRDLTSGSKRNFPQLTWRSPEPSCIVLDVDAFDPFTSDCKDDAACSENSDYQFDSQYFNGEYAVLCRFKNGLSQTHSVQIGPQDHIPIRLENSDLDLGVELSTVRLCGDCLVVSGSHGFVGSGRIPPLLSASSSDSPYFTSTDAGESDAPGPEVSSAGSASSLRIYIRRMVNCFHAEDTRVTSLAVPRSCKPSGPGSDGGEYSKDSGSNINILASGDEIGGMCVWRQEDGGRGVIHFPTYDGQQSKHRHRAGYSWQCVHRARVGNRITALSFSPDGKILAVTTPERALLFDISQLLVDVGSQTDRHPRSTAGNRSSAESPSNKKNEKNSFSAANSQMFAIRSVVLDDLVGSIGGIGMLSYGVDLSTPGWVKLWKISTCTGRNAGDKVQFMKSRLAPLLARLESVQHARSIRELFPNTMTAQYNHKSRTHEVYEVKATSRNHESSVEKSENKLDDEASARESSPCIKNYSSNHDADCAILDGYSVDPFYYSDLCVIDPVRNHIRDWWCDYSSRFLLLGHSRLASLSSFEASILVSNTQSSSVSPLSSLSRNASDSSKDKRAGVEAAAPGRGLDRQSSTMFWSTLTNSLGRRVIGRYYVPNGYYSRLLAFEALKDSGFEDKHCDSKSSSCITPLLEDCLRFCLTLSRCLYECLGDEYIHSLLVSWKAAGIDAIREIWERKGHGVFKDITICKDILMRFELSPDLALSSLNDLVSILASIQHDHADRPRHSIVDPNELASSTLTSPLTSEYVEGFLKSIQDSIGVVYDEQGLQNVVPSGRMIYIRNGGIPPLGSSHFQQVVDEYMLVLQSLDVHSGICAIIHILRSLVIDPLNHFERTEPFAVALCVVGLKGIPSHINDVIASEENSVNQPKVSSSPSDRKPLSHETTGHSSLSEAEECEAVYTGISIESLINRIAKDTPPWIRFVLASDSDKVLHE